MPRLGSSAFRRRTLRAGLGVGIAIGLLLVAGPFRPEPRVEAADPPVPAASTERLTGWRYVQELAMPARRDARLLDFILPVAVFDGAREDLGDLRLYDLSGREVPYALRIRRRKDHVETIPAREFNRSKDPAGASEVALDLGENAGEHNEVVIQMLGANYRRGGALDGSDDGKQWRALAAKKLLRFNAAGHSVDDRRFVYPPSRFRYLRVRIERDPVEDEQPVEIESVVVQRKAEEPGESLDQPATIGPRQAVRAADGPGSAWVIELGGDHIPCERLTVEAAGTIPEFVRNYRIDAGGPALAADQPFQQVSEGLWRRTAGGRPKPLAAEFPEVLASRLRLLITDHRNPPLELRGASFRAPAREVVFADPGPSVSALRLYYGNPRAEAPQYDFARNLPPSLDPPALRMTLARRTDNPDYRPETPPLTERWPWLIYVILGAISLVLGAILVSLARRAIARADAERPPPEVETAPPEPAWPG